MSIIDELAKKTYLGDGVYAHHDGYQIWLTTLEGNRIAVEPSVMIALVKYDEETKRVIEIGD
jgi:hypothetical protein